VFERPPDYDTGQDPVVRATAGEIRKKLAQYYQESGHETEPRIDLLAGSYIAEFHTSPDAPDHGAAHKPRKLLRIGLSIAVAAVRVVNGTLLSPQSKETALDQMWRPVLKSPGTLLISLGQPIVYNLRSAQAQDELQGIQAVPKDSATETEFVSKKDLVILPERYAAMGDVFCLVRLATMLEKVWKTVSHSRREIHVLRGPPGDSRCPDWCFR
jgi:hypothetical protein